MKHEWIKLNINKLKHAEWNYKKEDEHRQQVLVNNIKKNGQLENIIVRLLNDGEYEVVNGNHRLKAFLECGFEDVMCMNLGTISDNMAKRIAIETNETKFFTDNLKLSELITDISKEFDLQDLSETTVFTLDDLNAHLELKDFDFDNLPKLDGNQAREGFGKVVLELPLELVEQFNFQLNRIKKALYPDDSLENISNITPMECLIQHIAQIPDEQLI